MQLPTVQPCNMGVYVGRIFSRLLSIFFFNLNPVHFNYHALDLFHIFRQQAPCSAAPVKGLWSFADS
ncbi:MAG: hypothetical protein WCI27_08675, partial [Candidatus Omnitrophota bacterium]